MHTLPDKAAANAISSIRKPISTPSSESELRNLSFMQQSIRHKGESTYSPNNAIHAVKSPSISMICTWFLLKAHTQTTF